MRLVIDTNRIIAALIRDSACRAIIVSKKFSFLTPEFTMTEIKKYEELILRKSKLTKEEYSLVLAILFENIQTISSAEYSSKVALAERLIEDPKDVPFLALALVQNCGVWSEDKHFRAIDVVKTYTTKEIIDLLGREAL